MSLEDPFLKYKVESDTTIHVCLSGEVKGKYKVESDTTIHVCLSGEVKGKQKEVIGS
jgi:hypothetical protein